MTRLQDDQAAYARQLAPTGSGSSTPCSSGASASNGSEYSQPSVLQTKRVPA